MKLKEKYNIPLFLAAFALVVFFVILLLLFPTQMNNGISLHSTGVHRQPELPYNF